MIDEALVPIRQQEFYPELLKECKKGVSKIGEGCLTVLWGYWETGEAIVRFEREGRIEVKYGEATLASLADDLGFSDTTTVYRMKQAAIQYPTREAVEAKLDYFQKNNITRTWTNFRKYALPSDRKHPEHYGGRETVIEAAITRLEGAAHDLQTLMDSYDELDNGVKEQVDGVIEQMVELSGEHTQSLPEGNISRSSDYLDYIRSLPCIVCDATPCDPNHVETGGTSLKGSDFATVPMCREHHSDYHQRGRSSFQEWHGIDLWWEVSKCLINYIGGAISND